MSDAPSGDKKHRNRAEVTRAGDVPWPWQHPDILEREYVAYGKSVEQLAEEWECHPDTIEKWVERYDLDRGRDVE